MGGVLSLKKTELKNLVSTGVLAALSIVLGKFLSVGIGNTVRIGFENLPIILASVAFGPIYGGACGVTADIIGSILRGYDINLLITLAQLLMGVIPALLTRYVFKSRETLSVFLSTVISHTVCSVLLKSAALYAVYRTPFSALILSRLVNYAIVAPVEGYLGGLLLRKFPVFGIGTKGARP